MHLEREEAHVSITRTRNEIFTWKDAKSETRYSSKQSWFDRRSKMNVSELLMVKQRRSLKREPRSASLIHAQANLVWSREECALLPENKLPPLLIATILMG